MYLKKTSFSHSYLTKWQNSFSIQLFENGKIVFGVRNGILILDPKTMQHNPELPDPYLTNIDVREKPFLTNVDPRKLETLQLKPKVNQVKVSSNSKEIRP